MHVKSQLKNQVYMKRSIAKTVCETLKRKFLFTSEAKMRSSSEVKTFLLCPHIVDGLTSLQECKIMSSKSQSVVKSEILHRQKLIQ